MKVSIISFSRAGYRLSEMLYWVMKERGYEVESYTKSKYTKKSWTSHSLRWTTELSAM